jgi:CTP synthase (UTP-ammonia lyase)
MPLHIGLIGDQDPAITAHRAIPEALTQAARQVDAAIDVCWIGTYTVGDGAMLAGLDAIWCVPGSPYRQMAGALQAIRHAREYGVPFLGTCGGFQHAVLEYARNMLGWHDADHAETAPNASRAVIAPLSCSLVEESGEVHLLADTHIRTAYGHATITEGYHCRYAASTPPGITACLGACCVLPRLMTKAISVRWSWTAPPSSSPRCSSPNALRLAGKPRHSSSRC